MADKKTNTTPAQAPDDATDVSPNANRQTDEAVFLPVAKEEDGSWKVPVAKTAEDAMVQYDELTELGKRIHGRMNSLSKQFQNLEAKSKLVTAKKLEAAKVMGTA